MNTKLLFSTFFLACFLVMTSCTSPRSIIASGKVTPKGAFKAGFNTAYNVSTAPLAEIKDITKTAVAAIDNKPDSLYYTESVATLTRGLVAFSLDPATPATDFYLRYGLADKIDVGYKYASGAHVFDAMYQFLGSTGTPGAPDSEERFFGSIGFQYSGQKSDLPSKVGLDKLSSILNYTLNRKDILVPLAFSYSFGPEETYGNVSFGVVYGHSFIEYGFNPSKKLVRAIGNDIEKIPAFSHKQNYSSFGAFLNAKLGYRYAYFLPAISFYYQNYGTYNLFGLQKESFKGVTIIPSLGLQLNLGYDKKTKKQAI